MELPQAKSFERIELANTEQVYFYSRHSLSCGSLCRIDILRFVYSSDLRCNFISQIPLWVYSVSCKNKCKTHWKFGHVNGSEETRYLNKLDKFKCSNNLSTVAGLHLKCFCPKIEPDYKIGRVNSLKHHRSLGSSKIWPLTTLGNPLSNPKLWKC